MKDFKYRMSSTIGNLFFVISLICFSSRDYELFIIFFIIGTILEFLFLYEEDE